MAEKFNLQVQTRTITGRANKQLRREGIIPANLFGKKIKSMAIQLPLETFVKIYTDAGETSIIELVVEGEKEKRPVLVSAVTKHPVTGKALHVDFHQVDLTEKVTATIEVELTGVAPAVEESGAVVVQQINELDVEALPMNLPEKIVLDISSLKAIGDTLTVADLKIDKEKVEIKAEPETIVVAAQEPQKEEVIEPTVTEVAEGEAAVAAPVAEGEKKPEAEKPAA